MYGQNTSISSIFNRPKGNLHSGPTFGILLAPSRRQVRPKPELFLTVEQMRLLAEERVLRRPTQLFILEPDAA